MLKARIVHKIVYELNRKQRMERIKANLIISMIALIGRLSLQRVQGLGAWIGRCIWRLNLELAQVTRKNLNLCYPELTKEEREHWVKASLEETGKMALEMCTVWEWPINKTMGLITEVRGQEYIDRALAENKGVVLLAPHLGNWELIGLYMSSQFSMAALYRPPRMKHLEEYMIKVRSQVGSELVPTDKRGVLRLFKILKSGGIVGILPDQEPSFSGGLFVPFFGVQGNTMKLVSKLVGKTQPVVLCTWAERLPDAKGFIIHVTEADPKIYSNDLETSVAALNRSVESCVRTMPLQYQWEYKRFRYRPKDEGLPHFYDD
jgi:KDO2-lipid IV(A) lauroyltransferase